MEQHCASCGIALPPGVVYALSVIHGSVSTAFPNVTPGTMPSHFTPTNALETLYSAAERRTSPGQQSALRPWLAATLSLICGLGQLYNGQIIKGVALLIGGIAVVLVWPLLVGKIAAGVLWLYAISDAYLVARHL
jgi:TM2 domain-containing membrane protein YozV